MLLRVVIVLLPLPRGAGAEGGWEGQEKMIVAFGVTLLSDIRYCVI